MFKIGSKVRTTDEDVGRLKFLILDPHQHEVTDLVVDLGGDEPNRIVSVADVGHVDADTVRLNIAVDEVRMRRRFSRDEMVVAGEDVGAMGAAAQDLFVWASPYQGANLGMYPPTQPMTRLQVDYGVGDRYTIIGKDSPVYTRGGRRVGTVDHLAVDPDTYQPRAVIVRLPGIRRRRVTVDIGQVAEWERGGVVIDMSRDQLKALPPFQSQRSDAAVATEIRQALVASDLPLRNIGVEAADGHVVIRGRAGSDDARRDADRLARRVPGVISLHNALVTDRILCARVESRLFDDPIGGLYPVELACTEGVVAVHGCVPNGAVRKIVLDIVDETPGVEAVADRLEERPEMFDGPAPAGCVPSGTAPAT